MYKTLTLLALLATIPAATARADDRCRVPRADWQSRDDVARRVAENHWTLHRIQIDDGCYEIDATDAQGRRIEVTLDPATLAVIEVEHDDDSDDDGEHRRRTPRPAPSATIAPPPNGLFGAGAPPRVQVN